MESPAQAAHAEQAQVPLFLFSLPRSGSTLTQRILGAHDEITTLTEPWILLPFLYTLRNRGIYAEYHHNTASTAIEDFCKSLPGGREDYLKEIRELVLRLYSRASQDRTRYFLDKTPRYHLVVDEILSMFPEGKFIFLWRNPLSVAASILDTWESGRWRLWGYRVDFFDGLENLVHAYKNHKHRVHAVRYEDLLSDPEVALRGIFDYLELPFQLSVVESFSQVKFEGKKGDSTGTHRYHQVSCEPLQKWKQVMNNPVRRAWCRRYLRWIGAERLAVMGYDLDRLLGELDAIPNSMERLGPDVLRLGYGQIREFFEPVIFKQKLHTIPDWKRIRTHR